MPTKTKIAGLNFESYVCNASGPLDSTLEELEEVLKNKGYNSIQEARGKLKYL